MHVSMERTVWGPSGVTRLTVNICGAARGAATREAASLETPEKASVEEARRYIILEGETAAETGDFDDVADGAGYKQGEFAVNSV